MPIYTAPVKDSLFNLNEVLNLSQYADLPGFDTIDVSLATGSNGFNLTGGF